MGSLGTNTTVALFRISLAFGYPCVKSSRMLIRSYFTVKLREEPESEKVVSPGVVEAAIAEMKRLAGVLSNLRIINKT